MDNDIGIIAYMSGFEDAKQTYSVKLKAAEAEIERRGQIMQMLHGHLDNQGQKWASEWFDSMGNVKPWRRDDE